MQSVQAALVGAFWGIFAVILGFSVTKNWQAWAIILAGVTSFAIGKACK